MKLIQTQEYILFIDEKNRGIEYGEVGVNMRHSKLEVETRNMGGYGSDKYYWEHKKCIAYYPLNSEAKELDLPELPNPFDNDFNDLEWNDIADEDWKSRGGEGNRSHFMYRQGYIHGAYKALQTQSKQFSLEDMKTFAKKCLIVANETEGIGRVDKFIDEMSKSLSTQQLPKEFIPEYNIETVWRGFDTMGWKDIKKLKSIINSEGKQELVGTYKY